jgi:lipopolysaccharide export system permease protein
MRTLDRYILGQYLITFLVIVAGFSVIFIVVDIFDRIPQLLRYGANTHQIFQYFILRIPYLFVLTAPVAVLLSGLFLMNTLSRYNETIAIRAAGISIRRMITPLLIFSFFFSIFILVFGEYILPKSEAQRNQLLNVEIKNRSADDLKLRTNIHYRGADNRLYYIGFFDGYRNVLNTIEITTLDPGKGQVVKHVTADIAHWKNGMWVFERCRVRTFHDGIPLTNDFFDNIVLSDLQISPDGFIKKAKKPMAMNFLELREYIAQLRKIGEKCSREEVDLQFKLAYPFANLIIILFSFPLATVSTRSRGRGMVFLLGILVCFLYMTGLRASQSLGYNELLSPMVAAWAPNLLFTGIGVYLLFRAEV